LEPRRSCWSAMSSSLLSNSCSRLACSSDRRRNASTGPPLYAAGMHP